MSLIRNKKGDVGLVRLSIFVFGVLLIFAGIYFVSALQEVSNVKLNATSEFRYYENTTYENLTAYPSPYNLSQKYIYDWRVNRNSFTLLNIPFEANATCGAGRNLSCDFSSYGNNLTSPSWPVWNVSGGYDGDGAYEFNGVDDDYISLTVSDTLDDGIISGEDNFSFSTWSISI